METGKVVPGAEIADQRQWYVMRDLKRCNAKLPAYKLLGDMKIEIFTPMVWKLVVRQGKRIPQGCLSCRICFSYMSDAEFWTRSWKGSGPCNTVSSETATVRR